MRALNTAATGMQAQQLNVEVIANNIANMNTTGFKRQRAEFQDLLYQNVERMGVQSSDAGTIVPTGVQVGVGVKAGSVYRVTEQGSITQTQNLYDVAIQGEGYFIVQLPDGYNTLIGENGTMLSGGQRQRVAIARALIKNAPILFLDEATSALDSETEQAIEGELDQIAIGRTTLVIAHRLSTIIDADQILVMEQGRIIERGTHRELLAAGGQYAQMWSLQQQERSTQTGG